MRQQAGAFPPFTFLPFSTFSTFSTFSAEVVALLQRGEYGWGATVAGTHLAGSLVMTIAGFASVGWLRAH